MALKILQSGIQPLGQFDGDDAIVGGLLGGECVVFASVAYTAADKATKDVFDGYAVPATPSRPYLTRLGNRSTDGYSRPVMLADEGITGYGTLFGSVVGGVAGQNVTGTVLGPHSTAGSGKITAWDKPGLYGVTIDALDATVQPTVVLAVGAKLYATINSGATGGIITATQGATTSAIGNFVEFSTNGSLVTTSSNLVGSFNPPDGALLTTTAKTLTQAVIYFNPNSF